LKAGVLALQGGVAEHAAMLSGIGAEVVMVRMPGDLAGLSCLILPGGESTALISLLERWGLIDPIRKLASLGMPMWGTCAGAILLSSEVFEIEHRIDQTCLGAARVRAVRNAFGRQVHSFQQDLVVSGLEDTYPGVFIRAPLLQPLSPAVGILASVGEGPVFLEDGNIWLSSFHPELTCDDRIHRLFLSRAVDSHPL